MANPAQIHSQRLEALAQVLPKAESLTQIEDQTERARAMLAFLTQWTQFHAGQEFKPQPSNPMSCPNCGKAYANEKSPYCSPDCREEAAFVRHFRAGLEGELAENPEKQAMLGQVFWTLLGGGFPLRQSLIPEKSRIIVMARHGGKCEICGKPAVKVDHIRTGCNRPINLRPVCISCARTKEFGDEGLLSSHRVQAQLDQLAPRLASANPIRTCDDPTGWDWRAFLNQRKARIQNRRLNVL